MSIYKAKGGKWFVGMMHRGKRTTIYLGRDIPEEDARRQGEVVESVIQCERKKTAVPVDLRRQAGMLPMNIRDTLKRQGLLKSSSLRDLFADHLATKSGMKAGTIRHYKEWHRVIDLGLNVTDISSVTKKKAEIFRDWCLERYSEATVSRGMRTCRTIFRYAVENGLILANPFDGVKGGSEVNESRQFYVGREIIERLMKSCRDDLERFAIVLARFGGLRIPSEIRLMRHCDIGRDVIRIAEETKTGSREVPLFKEVRDIYARINRTGGGLIFENELTYKQGSWKMLKRVIEDAGLERWPKLWTNLRSSCITDFMTIGYGTKTLDKVFGNSVRIRKKHYLQYFMEAEYRKMLLDNELIVEYLQANGGTPDGILEPQLLQRIVNSYAFSK